MKTNFKIGDTVKVIKSGILNDLEGDILSINPDNKRPVTIISKTAGSWSFTFDEVLLIGKANTGADDSFKPVQTPKEKDGVTPSPKQKVAIRALKSAKNKDVATTKEKRPYKKRGEAKEVKVKRQYNKKPKA